MEKAPNIGCDHVQTASVQGGKTQAASASLILSFPGLSDLPGQYASLLQLSNGFY